MCKENKNKDFILQFFSESPSSAIIESITTHACAARWREAHHQQLQKTACRSPQRSSSQTTPQRIPDRKISPPTLFYIKYERVFRALQTFISKNPRRVSEQQHGVFSKVAAASWGRSTCVMSDGIVLKLFEYTAKNKWKHLSAVNLKLHFCTNYSNN